MSVLVWWWIAGDGCEFTHVFPPSLASGELELEKVPPWEFTGTFLQKEQKAGAVVAAEVDGKGFNPWQFPQIHDKL